MLETARRSAPGLMFFIRVHQRSCAANFSAVPTADRSNPKGSCN